MNLSTDHHCHLLPGMDDGARDAETSKKMMEMLVSQGVRLVYATPHFYRHRENVSSFLERRERALEAVAKEIPASLSVSPAAEVALENGISGESALEDLVLKDRFLLIELPFTGKTDWVGQEIDNIVYGLSIFPVFAHIERYVPFYPKDLIEQILSVENAAFQLTNDALGEGVTKKLFKRLLSEEKHILLGSDAHNAGSRPPDFDRVVQPLKKLLRKGEPEDLNLL